MFDIGWSELLVIGVVALIVVGPKDLPKLFRTVGQFMGKARGMAREFQRSMEQAADESGLKEASRDLHSVSRSLNTPTASPRKYAENLVRGDKASGTPKPTVTPKPKPAPAAADAPPEAAPAAEAAAAPEAAATESAAERGDGASRS